MAVTKKVRFRNRDDGLRVIYDESGAKRELVPGGTIQLEPRWGGRFRCLEMVKPPAPKTATKKKEEEEK